MPHKKDEPASQVKRTQRRRGVNIWDIDPARLPCGEGSTSSAWIGRRAGDRRFSFTGSSRDCPRAKADYELSRCAASADHEFRRGLDSSGMLSATARHLSRIELADLLGLHVARRGFWDAAFPIPLEGKRRQRRRLVGTRVGLSP